MDPIIISVPNEGHDSDETHKLLCLNIIIIIMVMMMIKLILLYHAAGGKLSRKMLLLERFNNIFVLTKKVKPV